MARQKTSPLEEMILGVSKMPWWAGLTLALVSFLVLHAFASRPVPTVTGPGQLGAAMTSTMISTLARLGQYVFPFAFGLAGVVSAINSTRQKKLYDTVAKRPGVASLNEMSWGDFERLVSEFYRRKGYQVTREGGNGPDGGIDLVLRQNGETYLVQCKQWKAYKVGVQPVREFYGAMASRGVAGGYFVTSGEYTNEAKSFAQGLNLELVDGRKLRQMIDIAQQLVQTRAEADSIVSPLAQISPVCPKCGAEMKRRMARQGNNAGNEFWGCTSYPKCNGIKPIDAV